MIDMHGSRIRRRRQCSVVAWTEMVQDCLGRNASSIQNKRMLTVVRLRGLPGVCAYVCVL